MQQSLKPTSAASLFLGCLLLCLANPTMAQHHSKRALLIGIGNYAPGTGWKPIHGDRDLPMLKQALIQAGFEEKDLLLLKNEQATKVAISNAFQQLLDNCQPGDKVLFHFSGHGQQLRDLNGDEADGLDEALAPFDAPAVAQRPDTYSGDQHLIDDELESWINRLRRKLGSGGQLLFSIDACHSGTASKGNGRVRGAMPPLLLQAAALPAPLPQPENESGYFNSKGAVAKNDAQSSFSLIAATQANKQDYEYADKQVGSLSYAFAEALKRVPAQPTTIRELFEQIRNNMAIIVPFQTPQLEGDRDVLLFNGSLVLQQAWYHVTGIDREGLLELNAGQLLGLNTGAVIGLYPPGTREIKTAIAFAGAEVVRATPLRCWLKPDKKVNLEKALSCRAFQLAPSFEIANTLVYLEQLPDTLIKALQSSLPAKRIKLTNEPEKAALILTRDTANPNQLLLLNAGNRSLMIPPFSQSEPIAIESCDGRIAGLQAPLEYIIRTISNYSRNTIIRKVTLSDPDFGISLKLLPAIINRSTAAITWLPDEGIQPKFSIHKSQAVLRIKNTGKNPGYVYLLEFNPAEKLCPILGFDGELRLEAGQSRDIELPDGFVPPAGRYLLKAYITRQPIGNELSWLITEQEAGTRASSSPIMLIQLLGELIENPGIARGPKLSKSGGLAISNFAYDLDD